VEEDNVISLRSFRKKKDNNLAFKDAIFEFKEMLRKLTETIESTIGPGEDTEHFIEAAIQRNLKLQEFVNQWMEYLAETERQTETHSKKGPRRTSLRRQYPARLTVIPHTKMPATLNSHRLKQPPRFHPVNYPQSQLTSTNRKVE